MARLFDTQSTDIINCGSAAQFDDKTDLTWTLWFKHDANDPTSEDYVFGKINEGADGKRLSIEMSGENFMLNFDVDTDGQTARSRTFDFIQDAWQFVAVTWSALTEEPRLWRGVHGGVVDEVDYTQFDPGSGNMDSEAEDDVAIGGKIPTSTFRSFYGALADVRWFDTAIPNEEFLTAIMYGAYARGDELIGWWPLLGYDPEPDWSGDAGGANAPGTVIGATVVDGPPIRAPFAGDEYAAYAIAVAAARRVIVL